jgi:GNAT superfamily N-acetyltransferase
MFELSEMTASDGPDIDELARLCPDGGSLGIRLRFEMDAVEAWEAQSPGCVGVVARTMSGAIAGMGLVSVHPGWTPNGIVPVATLFALMVHPEHRGNGLAKQLASWRIDRVRSQHGDTAVILANVQDDNAASASVAQKWANGRLGPLTMCFASCREDEKVQTQIVVRDALPGELAEAADGQNAYFDGCWFRPVATAEQLASWVEPPAGGQQVRHYVVAVDPSRGVVAGAAVITNFQIMQLEVAHMPWMLRMVNNLTGFLPMDRPFGLVQVEHIWYRDGHADAGQALFGHLRSRWHDRASHIFWAYDPRLPTPKATRQPFWVPKGSFYMSAQGTSLPGSGEKLFAHL